MFRFQHELTAFNIASVSRGLPVCTHSQSITKGKTSAFERDALPLPHCQQLHRTLKCHQLSFAETRPPNRHSDARKSMPLVPQHHLTKRRRHIGPPSQGTQLIPSSQPQRWQTNRQVGPRTSSGIPSPPNEAGKQRGRASPAYRTSATATVEPIHPSLHSCAEVPKAHEGRGGTSARRRERSHKETTAVATL